MRTDRRQCFTLVEVLVAFSVIAIAAGALLFGISKSVRSTQLATSKQRIERMLLQAFRFSAVSGHVGDVVIEKKEEGGWEGSLNLWEIDSKGLGILARKCSAIGSLGGIESVSLNDRDVHSLTFRFFGGHGLSAIYAYDQYGGDCSPMNFRSTSQSTHIEQELEISLRPTVNPTPKETISLTPYLLSIPRHLPFPNEYLQKQ